MTNDRTPHALAQGGRIDEVWPFTVSSDWADTFVAKKADHRGKRARRAAFYHRQRRERHLKRVVTILANQGAHLRVIENAHRDALVTGTGWAGWELDPDGRLRSWKVADAFYDGPPGEGPCPD